MTLLSALDKALDPATHPSNLTPLRQIVAHVVTDPADARRGLIARLLLAGFKPSEAPYAAGIGAIVALPVVTVIAALAIAALERL